MVIFHSYLGLPEGIWNHRLACFIYESEMGLWQKISRTDVRRRLLTCEWDLIYSSPCMERDAQTCNKWFAHLQEWSHHLSNVILSRHTYIYIYTYYFCVGTIPLCGRPSGHLPSLPALLREVSSHFFRNWSLSEHRIPKNCLSSWRYVFPYENCWFRSGSKPNRTRIP